MPKPSHNGWINADFLALLDNYRDAVASRARWEDKGTRKDGKLESAAETERVARKAIVTFWHAVDTDTVHNYK